MVIIPHLRALN